MKVNERKIAQVAAFFLKKRGSSMSHLKLMKLMYLADRESMKRYEWPITADCMVSMPHGPVLSGALNLIDGDVEYSKNGWATYISSKRNNEVALRSEDMSFDDLDELSEADIEVMEAVWDKFGQYGRWEIRDYTHEHCPEWKDPQGSSIPLDYKDVFLALGKSEDEASELSSLIHKQHRIDNIFASL